MQGGTSIGAGQIQKRYAYTSTTLTLTLNLTLIHILTLTLTYQPGRRTLHITLHINHITYLGGTSL